MQVAGFRGGRRHDAVDVRHACKRRTGDCLGLVIGGFALFNLAMNAGPNATTFTLAPTLFPTSIRGSAPGFAAMCLSHALKRGAGGSGEDWETNMENKNKDGRRKTAPAC